MFHHHWGDLPTIPDTESGIAAIEREQITKPRPVEVQGAKLLHPFRSEVPTTCELPAECCAIDGITLHTILLIQHAKKIRSLIQSMQHQETVKLEGDNSLSSPIPPIPPFPKTEIKEEPETKPKKRAVNVSYSVSRQILRRSVAAVCAYSGFDTTTESVLDTLTDITHEYYLRFGRLLRTIVDREALTGYTGFVDALEQAFQENGTGSLTELHSFYQTRVLSYHKNMLKTCQQLTQEYEKLKTPESKVQEDNKSLKEKEDLISDIHFPVMEENEETPVSEHETPLQFEELHGGLQTEPETTLKDEETIKWPGKQENVQNSCASLDLDEEIIDAGGGTPSPDLEHGLPSLAESDTLSPTMEGMRMGKLVKKN